MGGLILTSALILIIRKEATKMKELVKKMEVPENELHQQDAVYNELRDAVLSLTDEEIKLVILLLTSTLT